MVLALELVYAENKLELVYAENKQLCLLGQLFNSLLQLHLYL